MNAPLARPSSALRGGAQLPLEKGPAALERLRPLAAAAAGLLLALVLSAPVWLPAVGTFLLADDGPAPADAIVVLAGNSPDRLPHAEALWRAGYAPLLIVSNERVHTYGLDTTWFDLYRAHLSAPDLPPEAVLVLDNPLPESTIDEARRAPAVPEAPGLHHALLVTDAFHSRRA